MSSGDRVITLCQEIADWLRAVAMDEDEILTPEERRALIEVALAVERRGAQGRLKSYNRVIADPA